MGFLEGILKQVLGGQSSEGGLAGLLPVVIDQLAPDGKVPESGSLENTLGSLLSGLGR